MVQGSVEIELRYIPSRVAQAAVILNRIVS